MSGAEPRGRLGPGGLLLAALGPLLAAAVFFGGLALLLHGPDAPGPEGPWTYHPTRNDRPVDTAPVEEITAPVEDIGAPVEDFEAPVEDASP